MYIKNTILFSYFRRWYLCGAEKQSQRVHAHGGAVRRRKGQWITDRNSGTYIVYNSYVTCSNSSGYAHISLLCFPLVYIVCFPLATCLYLPLSPNSTSPTVRPVFNITTVGLVTFQQSACWYHPWTDVVLSTSSDTQQLWTWWHFGDHTICQNIRRILFRNCLIWMPSSGVCQTREPTLLNPSSDSVSHNWVQGIPVLLLSYRYDWTCNLQMFVSLGSLGNQRQ